MPAREVVTEHFALMRRERLDEALAQVAEDAEVGFADRPGGGRDVYAAFLRDVVAQVHESRSSVEIVDLLASDDRAVVIHVVHHRLPDRVVPVRRITEFEVADGLIRRVRTFVADTDAALAVLAADGG